MKVLSFLQCTCFLAVLNEEKREIAKKFIQFVKSKGFDNGRDFYSQPFKPELITELFEGWEEISAITYWSATAVFAFHLDSFGISTKNPEKTCWIFFPRTLDEFIIDCQKAGVELIWRKDQYET